MSGHSILINPSPLPLPKEGEGDIDIFAKDKNDFISEVVNGYAMSRITLTSSPLPQFSVPVFRAPRALPEPFFAQFQTPRL